MPSKIKKIKMEVKIDQAKEAKNQLTNLFLDKEFARKFVKFHFSYWFAAREKADQKFYGVKFESNVRLFMKLIKVDAIMYYIYGFATGNWQGTFTIQEVKDEGSRFKLKTKPPIEVFVSKFGLKVGDPVFPLVGKKLTIETAITRKCEKDLDVCLGPVKFGGSESDVSIKFRPPQIWGLRMKNPIVKICIHCPLEVEENYWDILKKFKPECEVKTEVVGEKEEDIYYFYPVLSSMRVSKEKKLITKKVEPETNVHSVLFIKDFKAKTITFDDYKKQCLKERLKVIRLDELPT
jgi:hypothetical protein